MRLVDKVMQSPSTFEVAEPSGMRTVTGAGSIAHELRDVRLRYILDRDASRRCSELIFSPGGVLTVDDEIVRMPAPRFWLECYPDGPPAGPRDTRPEMRLGFLVDASSDGRSGQITCLAENMSGSASLLAGFVEFDFDNPSVPAKPMKRYRMRHDENAEIAAFLEHARLVIRDEWIAHIQSLATPYDSFVARQAEMIWFALPIVRSFSALLNSPRILRERPSSLQRLNVARSRSGKPPLMDHIEIGLNLDPKENEGKAGWSNGHRSAPRLHFVRGHRVTRAGQTFWRNSHFRGDGVEEPIKTVRVTSRSSHRVAALGPHLQA